MCLSKIEIIRLLRLSQTSKELVALRIHAKSCYQCKNSLKEAAEFILIESVALSGGHISSEHLSEFLDDDVNNLSSKTQHKATELHIKECGLCSKRYRDLRHSREDGVPTLSDILGVKRRTRFPVQISFAAAAVIVALGLFSYSRIIRHSVNPPSSLRSYPRTYAGTMNTENQPVHHVQNMEIAVARAVTNLIDRETLRGKNHSSAGSIRFLKPFANENLLTPPDTIVWKPVTHDAEYRVTISGLYGNVPGQPLSGYPLKTNLSMVPAPKLLSGRAYDLQADAYDRSGILIGYNEIRIRILTPERAGVIKVDLANIPAASPSRALYCLKHNLYTEALQSAAAMAKSSFQNRELAQKIIGFVVWKE